MFNKIKNALKNKKGSAIFQFIIILAIVAIIAVVTLPDLNETISEKATGSINRIDTMDSSLDE